ncbi:MAG: Ig-like domain-containing protein [Actinobacteria bacterium]|nr:Ig-like domain-containing protein [Actinomycetota bacterium]
MRRRRVASLCVVAAICSAMLNVNVVRSAELTPFNSIYSANLTGSFTLTGNTNQSCSTVLGDNSSSCADARNFNGTLSDFNNDVHVMRNTEIAMGNIDSKAIFNSSANEISVPSGSTISKAYLFWFGTLEVPQDSSFGITPVNEAERGTVLFAGSNDDCSGAAIVNCEVDGTVSTESLGAGQDGFYVAHADVTNKIATDYSHYRTTKSLQESEIYSVGNIQGAQGIGTSAGWTLMIVYANAAEELRHIEIKSGLALVAPRSAHNFEFTGFDSSLVGDINSVVGFAGVDGDAGTVGDSLTMRGASASTLISNFVNPSNNVFNSSVSIDGTRSNYLSGGSLGKSKNTFGVEADRFTVTNALDHGANSARLTFNSTADSFYIAGIAFATPLGKSELKLTKYISGVTQGGLGSNTEVSAGDMLEYKVSIDNVGVNTATNVSLQDDFDSEHLTNVQTNNGNCSVVGNKLTCTNLGNLTPTASPIIVAVIAEVKPGIGTISNFALATYGGHQGPSTAFSNVVTTDYAKLSTDLALALNFTKPYVQAGSPVKLRSRITNYGPSADDAPKLQLTIPAGLTRTSKLPNGCKQETRKITCAPTGLRIGLGESLLPGKSVQLDLVFLAAAGQSKYRVYGVTQTGNTSGDSNLSNNFARALVGVNHPPVARRIFMSTSTGANAITQSISNSISDPDLDSLQVTLGAVPSGKGSLRLVGSNLVYIPNETYAGTFTVQYFLSDGRGGKASSVITVQVLPSPVISEHKCRGFVRTGC